MIVIDCLFGHNLPLGHLSRTFEPGRLYGISGPNGSGKSTLLSTIAGELDPIDGTVLVDGLDPASSSGAGVVTRIAEPSFYPDLSVGEHLKLMGISEDIIELWALTELLGAPPGWLSSGQRQRVFLGSQLPVAAGVIVIDEPERHLDADWVEFLCEELVDIAGEGSTVIVASHSPVVLEHCDNIVVL